MWLEDACTYLKEREHWTLENVEVMNSITQCFVAVATTTTNRQQGLHEETFGVIMRGKQYMAFPLDHSFLSWVDANVGW